MWPKQEAADVMLSLSTLSFLLIHLIRVIVASDAPMARAFDFVPQTHSCMHYVTQLSEMPPDTSNTCKRHLNH